MPCGNRAYVAAAVKRAAARGATEDVHALRSMGTNSQEKMLLLKHCISSKLAHIARWGPASQYEEAAASRQRAIKETCLPLDNSLCDSSLIAHTHRRSSGAVLSNDPDAELMRPRCASGRVGQPPATSLADSMAAAHSFAIPRESSN